MQDQADTNPTNAAPSATSRALPGGALPGGHRPIGNGSLPILPHILAAIFGVFAIAIVILWLSIGVWSRPDPDHLAPVSAQPQPAQSQP
nr:hypothetical protein [Novosphingobium panipatense]